MPLLVMKFGGTSVADLSRIENAADKVQADIVSGAMHPFTGPIKDQKGVERLAAGARGDDALLSKMDWYVEGVQS